MNTASRNNLVVLKGYKVIEEYHYDHYGIHRQFLVLVV